MTVSATSLLWLTGTLAFLFQDPSTRQPSSQQAAPQQQAQAQAQAQESNEEASDSEPLTWPVLLGVEIPQEDLDRLPKEPLALIDGLNKSRGDWLFRGEMSGNDSHTEFAATLHVEGGFKTHFEEVGRPGPGWTLTIQWPTAEPVHKWTVFLLPIMEGHDLQWRGHAQYARVDEESNPLDGRFYDGHWDLASRTLTLPVAQPPMPRDGDEPEAPVGPDQDSDADGQFTVTIKENGELEINGFQPNETITLSGETVARIGEPYVEPDLNQLTLPNGYKVFFASRLQVSLVDSEGSGVAGARLEKIGCHEDIIFGLITQREGIAEPDDKLGYFWMDSATGEIIKGMELGPWSEKLRELGVNEPQMLNPEQVGPKF